MSIYSDKLAHVQVVINYPYLVAQKCTREDTLAHNIGGPYFDDVMSYNSLTTSIAPSRVFFGQVSTRTGHYQLPLFGCTKVHP